MIQNSTIVNSNDKLTFKLKGVNESGEQETSWMEELIDIMYDLMWENKNLYISMAYHGDEDNIVEITTICHSNEGEEEETEDAEEEAEDAEEAEEDQKKQKMLKKQKKMMQKTMMTVNVKNLY